MAYNIFAEADKKINWEELHQKITPIELVEYVPMPNMGIDGGDALGISIPSKNIGELAWEELRAAIEILMDEFHLNLYDMYYGIRIDSKVLIKIRENLII